MTQEVLRFLAMTRWSRWALVLSLALVAGGFEAISAALVLVLLQMITDPKNGMVLPVVGDLREISGGMSEQTLLLSVLAAIGGFFLVRAVVKVLQIYVQQRVMQKAGYRLAARLVDGYLRMPYAWHLQTSSAALIRTAHQSVNQVTNQVLLPTITILSESLLLVMILGVLLVASPIATLMAVIIIGPTAYMLMRVVQPMLKRLGSISHDAVRIYFSVLQESLTGIQDLKVFRRTRFFSRRFSQERAAYAKAAYVWQTMAQAPSALMELALMAFIILFFAYTVQRGDPTEEALPLLGLFAYAGLRLKPSIQRILRSFNTLRFASAPMDEVSGDLAKLEHAPTSSSTVQPLLFAECIVFDNVSYQFEGSPNPTLIDVNLRIAKGESLGVCGPTGGGKSTLINLLLGLLQPTAGVIRIDGRPLVEDVEGWQANLGIVPQAIFLLDDTLRRNIAFGIPDSGIDDARVWKAIRLAQLTDFATSLPDGLETRIGERGTRLSGGQRQRVAIARALYIEPPVLIFDEGTSALDMLTETELVRTLKQMGGNRTMITVAHRLSTIRDTNQIIVVEDGRITATGRFEELLASHPFLQDALD